MSAGEGNDGAVECSTGGGVNVNCLEDDKPKPKQCPTPACGVFLDRICRNIRKRCLFDVNLPGFGYTDTYASLVVRCIAPESSG